MKIQPNENIKKIVEMVSTQIPFNKFSDFPIISNDGEIKEIHATEAVSAAGIIKVSQLNMVERLYSFSKKDNFRERINRVTVRCNVKFVKGGAFDGFTKGIYPQEAIVSFKDMIDSHDKPFNGLSSVEEYIEEVVNSFELGSSSSIYY